MSPLKRPIILINLVLLYQKEGDIMKKIIKDEMDIVFLLDRSGSMGGIEDDTIGGYNSYIKDQKKNNVLVTTVLFDDRYEMLTDRLPIKKVDELNRDKYYVRGSTALLDAIGKSINYIDSKKSKKALFIITTDGYENSSREYSKDKIKEMIKKHVNYEFIYIGADIDSYAEAASIGIERCNTASYKKDKKGISTLFKSVSKASSMMCEDACLGSSWKEDLDNYIKENS